MANQPGEIRIDTDYLFQGGPGLTWTVTSTGMSLSGLLDSDTWTYTGDGTFLGFSRTSGATEPDSDLEIGDSGTEPLTIYSVASSGGGGVFCE